MKNFRKVLALVLVVATLFSFTAMASAKTYTDADKISYKEAVDVLSYVGILNGYEDDSFKPTQTITREEMAKMIAVLSNAGTDVSTLYASACTFADVAKDRWSASYVAYCAKTGIVAGRSASTFDPTAKVTGLETAKMLLVVLGFNAEKQGYVGADWKVNVLRDAKTMGLLNGFADKYNVEAAITREEAAQMMLNALEAPCVVGFLSNNNVTVTNALVFGGYKWDGNQTWTKVSSYATLLDAMKAGNWSLYGNVVISDDILAETLFGLKKSASSANDCYMRPGSYWTWVDAKGNTVKITGTTLKPVWSSYNTTVAEIEKVYKSYNLNNYYVMYYRNGKNGVLATDPSAAGKGSLVEIYEIPAATGKSELRIVEIETFIDYITDVDTYHKTVTLGTGANKVTGDNTFGLKTTDEGKVALYWVCGKDASDLHAVELATPKALTVTKAVKDNTSTANKLSAACCFYAGSDKYEYADTFNTTINLDLKVLGEEGGYGVGEEWNVYFDKYGFVMGYTQDNSIDYQYGVVPYGTANKYYDYTNKVNGDQYSYTVKMVNFEKNPAVGDAIAATKAMYDFVDNSKFQSDCLVKYYVSGDKVTVDAEAATNTWSSAFDLDKGELLSFGGYYFTRDTQILLRVKNLMTGKFEYKYFDGVDELDASYKVENLSFYKSGKYVTYAYGEAAYTKTSDTAYILGENTSVVYLTDGSQVVGYNTYRALVDGEEVVIATQDRISTFQKVYNMNLVRIGLLTDEKTPVYFQATPSLKAVELTDVTIDTGKGLMFYGSNAWYLDDDAKFILVFTDGWQNKEYSAPMTAAELVEYTSNWEHVYVWADDTDGNGAIDLVYVNAEDGLHEGGH